MTGATVAKPKDNRVAIVTGSVRGIGRAIAMRLVADGVHVVLNCKVDVETGRAMVAEIEQAGGRAVLQCADVADSAQLRGLFDCAEAEFGGTDIFVHNASSFVSGAISQATEADYDHLYAVNSRATFIAMREAADRMRDDGRVVLISSGATTGGGPSNIGLYTASQAAGEALVTHFARELGTRGITVNTVAPGVTRTRNVDGFPPEALAQIAANTALRRIGEPEDIADIVGFLASDAGRWVTGQRIGATGGL